MKTEKGAMIVKGEKGWGITYSGGGHGECEESGWVDLEDAKIYDPKYFTQPTDATYPGSPDIRELSTGKCVLVERTTSVKIL